MEHAPLLIEGRIVFKSTVPAFNCGTIHIYVEDISYADAEALKITEKTIANVQHNSTTAEKKGETVIDLKILIEDEIINSENDYAVRVWVDVDSDGKESSQDFYSDESFRVLTRGFGNKVEIMFSS